MKVSIAIKQWDNDPDQITVERIVQLMNERFHEIKTRNPQGFLDQFEAQFDTICLEIAQSLGGTTLNDDENNTVFDFTRRLVAA